MATSGTNLLTAPGLGPARRTISWRVVAPLSLLAFAPLPLLALHARDLWLRSHYRFFPFVLLGAVALAVPAGRRLGPRVPGSRRVTAPLLGLSWLLLAIACLFYSPGLGAVAALAMLVAVGYAAGGGRLLRPLLPAWAFLGLLIPPPFDLDLDLITYLQGVTSRASSSVLDTLGVFHVMEGNVVCVPGRDFLVEEACSGIHSLFVVLASALFFVIRARRPATRSVALVLAGVAWVLVGNVARIVVLVYAGTRWGVDLSRGWRHEALGLFAFLLILGLLASTDSLLWFVPEVSWRLPPRRQRGRHRAADPVPRPFPPVAPPTRMPNLSETWLASWPVAVAFALLGVAQVVVLGEAWADLLAFRSSRGSEMERRFAGLGAGILPAVWGAFRREGFDAEHRENGDALGEFSRTWRYQFRGYPAVLSVNFPFKEWHELTQCYVAQGWTLRGRRVHRGAAAGGGEESPFVEAWFANLPGRHGYLLFGMFDQRGRPREPGRQVLGHLRQRLLARLDPWGWWGRRGWSDRGSVVDSSYQVQLFVEGEYPLTRAEQDQARACFESLRQTIRRLGPGVAGGTP